MKALDSDKLLDNPKDRLKSRVVGVFNQKGIAVLEEAARAAKQVWSPPQQQETETSSV